MRGRDAELARLRGLLGSGPAFVVLTGEPGIGKSRLCAELAAAAVADGTPVLRGRATEVENSLPWALFLDALDDLEPPVAQPELFGADGGPVIGVERHRLHRRVRAVLEAGASASGLLLVLDDVHWADTSSLELADHLVRHPPHGVLTVLATRTGRLPALLLRSLESASVPVTRMTLGPLSPADADLLLPGRSAASRRRLYEIGGGNPLHLEILGQLPEAEIEALRGARMPGEAGRGALDALISRELRHLAEPLGTVARAAAVAANTLDAATVAAVAQLAPEEVPAALDALVEQDVLRAGDDGRLGFRHPLVRAAAYRLAGPSWLAGAHRRAADWLARQGAPLALRADHLLHGMRPGDVDAAGQLEVAAMQSADTAPASAVQWLRASVRALPDGTGDAELADRRDELRLKLAQLLAVSGRFDEARTILHELAGGTTTAPRYRALELLAASERALGRLPEARALLEAALTEAGGSGADLLTALLGELAAIESLDGEWDAAAHRAEQALRLSGPGSRSGADTIALTFLGLAELYRCRFAAGEELLERARRHLDALTDPQLCDDMAIIAALAYAEFLTGRIDDALRHLERGLRIARHYGRDHVVPEFYVVRSLVHSHIGSVDQALMDAEDGEEIARHLDSAELRTFVLAVKSRPLLWHSGAPEALALVARLRAGPPLRSAWRRQIAELDMADVLYHAGDPAACRDLLTTSFGAGARPGPGPHSVAAYALRAQAEVGCGDRTAGWEWYERAAEAVAGGVSPARSGALSRARTVLLLAESRHGPAREEAFAAVDHFGAAGLRVDEGYARTLTARVLAAAGDTSAAREQWGLARQLFVGCGAPSLARWAGRQQQRTGSRPGRARTVLSAREQEIAELVADGLTSPRIADRLFLSTRTVESHISRIFAKLEVKGRVALARRIAAERDEGGVMPER